MDELDLSSPRYKRQITFVLYDQIARDFDELVSRCTPSNKTDLIAVCLRFALSEITGRADPKAHADIRKVKEIFLSAAQKKATAKPTDLAAIERFLREEMRRELAATVDASLKKSLAEFIERTPTELFHRMKTNLGGAAPPQS